MTTNQSNPPPLTGMTLALGSLSVGLAGFMTVLDSSIANVAIPTISGNLGVSVDEGTWVITVFAAANSIAIPLTGWLTQRLGQVRLFVGSILLFVLASWLCGIAPSLPFLLGARVLQGLVAGPLIPMSQALLLSSWPKSKSSLALSLFSMIVVTGPIVGPSLGGWVTDSYAWSWIFYINIPVGLFAATMVWFLYRKRDTPTRKLPIDFVGLTLLVVWVASLQVMLDKGKDLDWFSSNTIVILTIVAVVGLVLFIIWELTDKNPIVDLTLFKQRNFLGGTISIAVAYGIFFGTLVLLPQWMQEYLGYRAVDSGLATAPLGIFAVIGAPIMGKILPRSDARIIGTLAFVGFAVVYYMRTFFFTDISEGYIILPTLLQGIPMALFFAPLTVIILSGQPADKVPAAAGLSTFARMFFGGIGTSLAGVVWNNRTIMHHEILTQQASPTNPLFNAQMGSYHSLLGLGQGSSYALFDRVVQSQSAMLGLNDVFYGAAVVMIIIIPLIWITKPGKAGGASDAAAAAH
ncbi:DHA2 family efflux MFS transporter permease subunit [Burkholderia ubonensis]|uniref:DHA2 family efflux MFS transporter permease subunit n=1 Tax=Burkholderia ubonensis TaxID=101571 RepID=UPI00075925B8|nr:DHA2 family efflux MFS transporter permease subunit [Burkholderia ubonensis]KVS39958.1 disulfide bond formation protein DsbA [Burkholderia ubonensis]KVS48054.1 disulfide bond formation protein DsbA [Burkholderia ubonensis]KVS78787.1 disulfide bond formation protein DsbA [Burkholderia ubonensis]KVS93503.1 disulfide bond formation protein DsbA [Burkholderia ubonensis]KVS94248.1 disulfide bond formation protein DsbA [Burkholderia ubonensis]